jgi:peptide/nickel transport system permease protein
MLGLVSGYIGGITDRIISLVMDAMYAFPGLILAIAVAALLGAGIINMALAIAVVYIPSYYRMIRGIVLSIKATPYIEAVKAMGTKSLKILFRRILPNIVYSAIAVLPINFADSIIT